MSPITSIIGATVVSLGIAPPEDIARESVDLIEVNHFYDEHGRLVFDQVIFYDWSPADARYMVRAWRLVKNPAQLPQRDWRDGGYIAVWNDSCQGGEVLRHVHSQAIRETWTQYDPELVEREYLPKERRKELRAARLNRAASPIVHNRPAAPPQPRPAEGPEPSNTAAIVR